MGVVSRPKKSTGKQAEMEALAAEKETMKASAAKKKAAKTSSTAACAGLIADLEARNGMSFAAIPTSSGITKRKAKNQNTPSKTKRSKKKAASKCNNALAKNGKCNQASVELLSDDDSDKGNDDVSGSDSELENGSDD